MPYVNRSGNIAHGVAGAGAYLNNAQFDSGGGGGWFLPDVIAYQHGGPDGWFVMLYGIIAKQFTRGVTDQASPFYGMGCNAIFSGGGVWAAWANLPGVGLFSNTGLHLPDAGLIGVGPAGEIAYVADYQSGVGTIVRERDGSEWLLSAGIVYSLHLLGNRRAIWNDERQVIRTIGIPQPRQLSGAWAPKACQINGEWWVCYFCASAGVVLHPFDSFVGYPIVPTGDAWIDMSPLDASPSAIKVVWSVTQGEGAGHIRDRVVDVVADQRVDLEALSLVPVGRPMWLGFFAGAPWAPDGWDTNDDPPGTRDPHMLPGNGYLDVPSGGTFFDEQDKPIGSFITGGTVEAIEQAAAAAPHTPIAYWDGRSWPRWPNLPNGAWLCLQGYCRINESVDHFEASLNALLEDRRSNDPTQRMAIVAQCYTQPPQVPQTQTSDLRALVPAFARLAAKHKTLHALVPFSGNGRANGLQNHPEVRPLWDRLAASIPSAPEGHMTPPVRAPRFTLETPGWTFPIAAVVPIAVRCVYINEQGGEPDWIEWQYSTVGKTGPWLVAVRNPGSDKDHTFRFTSAGSFWIKARAGNVVGTHETGRERRVDAQPAVPVDPVDPPKPPSRVTSLKTAHGSFLGLSGSASAPWDVVNQTPAEVQFEIEQVRPKIVALKAPNGRYVCAEGGGAEDRLIANRDTVGGWEEFEVSPGVEVGTIALKAVNGRYVCAEGDGRVTVNREAPGPWESFTRDPAGRLIEPLSAIRIDGQAFAHDAGTLRLRLASLLTILTKPRDVALERMEEIRALGFNGFRVFCGDLAWKGQTPEMAAAQLPTLLEDARTLGLLVEVTALTGTASGYDARGYLARIAQTVGPHADHVLLELANEPYHDSQSGQVRDFEHVARWGREVVPAGVLWALGAPPYDEPQYVGGGVSGWPAPTGHFVTSHLDRGRPLYEQVRRVRELFGIMEVTGKPVVNNEPIGAAEQSVPGRRESNPTFFFLLGLLNRGFEVSGVFHSDNGLQTDPFEAGQRACAQAYIDGARLIPIADRLTYKNTGWSDSPVKSFGGGTRAYSFVSGNHGYTVHFGEGGLHAVAFQNGWGVREQLVDRPDVHVFAVQR